MIVANSLLFWVTTMLFKKRHVKCKITANDMDMWNILKSILTKFTNFKKDKPQTNATLLHKRGMLQMEVYIM